MTGSGPRPSVEVDVIVCATIPLPWAYAVRPPRAGGPRRLAAVLRGEGGAYPAPLLAYVVRHESAGPILIDTGLHPDASGALSRGYGRVLARVFGRLEPAAETFEEQLRARGLALTDVELVVMTHLHVDHTGAMRLLPNAQFVCARDEWAAATRPRAVFKGYARNHLPPASRTRLLDVERDGTPYGPFHASIDLLGDGSVRLLATPGHTPGHCSVLLQLPNGRELLVVGDAAYTMRNIDDQALPAITYEDVLAMRSLGELKAYADANPQTVLVPTHDPDAWRRVAAQS